MNMGIGTLEQLVTTALIPERDALISQGYSLPEMGEKLGVHHTTVFHYMKNTGQYAAWKALRDSGKGKTDRYNPKKLNPHTRDPNRDKLIKLGYAQGEIAKAVNRDRTTIVWYIQETGQHDIWWTTRQERLQLIQSGLSKEETDAILTKRAEESSDARIYKTTDDK